MSTSPSIATRASSMKSNSIGSFLTRAVLALLLAAPLAAIAVPPQTFATPEAAVDALEAALKADSEPRLLAIFGDEHKDADRRSRSCSGQREPREDRRGDANAARAQGAEP